MDLGSHPTPAVVIGLCVHGLAVCRALHHNGIPVHALESNKGLPGTSTSSAQVHFVDGIQGEALINNLKRVSHFLKAGIGKPVLFPINDKMVRTIAENWRELEHLYNLSWSASRHEVLRLANKANLASHCLSRSIRFPEELLLAAPDSKFDTRALTSDSFIAKPTRPLSSFKVKKINCPSDFEEIKKKHEQDFPIIVQPWIEGTDPDIYFCALYLEQGVATHNFEGRKILSHPPAMGQTTAAICFPNPEIRQITQLFFSGTKISGPVSLELKRDKEKRYWVIEPTVGRTDFWVDCCTANGVNFPLIEYRRQLEQASPDFTQRDRAIWLDTEADPSIVLSILRSGNARQLITRRPAFALLNLNDLMPSLAGVTSLAKRKLMRPATLPMDPRESTAEVNPPLALPEDHASGSLFSMAYWFNSLRDVVLKEGFRAGVLFVNHHGRRTQLPYMEKCRWYFRLFSTLAYYYTPLFSCLAGKDSDDVENIVAVISQGKKYDAARFYPMDPAAAEFRHLLSSFHRHGWATDEFFCSANWHMACKGISFATYYSSLNKRVKNTIRRKGRFLARSGSYSVIIHTETIGLSAILDDYEAVYENSWKRNEPYPDFIRKIATWAAENNWLRLGILYIDQVPAAAQIWFVKDKIASIFKLSYDDCFARYSPGTLLSRDMFEYVLEKDCVDEIDYLTGDDNYKRDWMTERRERWGIYAFNKHTPIGLSFAVGNMAGKSLKRLFQRHNKSSAADNR